MFLLPKACFHSQLIMRRVARVLRPFLRLPPSGKSFCSVAHTHRVQDIRQVFRLHEESLKNGEQFRRQFTDDYLLKLVAQNYCFSDIVDISNGVVYHAEGAKSDVKVLFLAYAYNLYYNELKRGKEVLLSISDALQARVAGKDYRFDSFAVEKHYLSNIKSLSNRYNNFLTNEVATLKNAFVRFLTLKYAIADQDDKYLPPTDKTLAQFLAFMPFVPKESIGCKYMLKIEKYYLQILRFELQLFLAKPDAEATRGWMRQTTTRFVLLMETGVMLGKLSGRYIGLFETLPTAFASEAKFANYLRLMREFFTYQMLSCLEFERFDNYSRHLSASNTAYRSPETVLAFENYVESLIVLKKNNLKVYSPYLGYDDAKDSPKQKEGRGKGGSSEGQQAGSSEGQAGRQERDE